MDRHKKQFTAQWTPKVMKDTTLHECGLSSLYYYCNITILLTHLKVDSPPSSYYSINEHDSSLSEPTTSYSRHKWNSFLYCTVYHFSHQYGNRHLFELAFVKLVLQYLKKLHGYKTFCYFQYILLTTI